MSRSNLARLLDQAEAAVAAGRKLPLSKRRVMDAEPLLELIDQMRLSIPEELREAERFMERKEAMASQALQQAKKIIADAEVEAKRKLNDTEVMKAARQEAEDTLAKARAEAEAMTRQAREEAEKRRKELDQYAQRVMARLEEYLAGALSQVRGGLETLRADSTEGAPGKTKDKVREKGGR